MGFFVPKKPAGDIDELLRKFAMPLDMTDIVSFDELRSFLSFYTSEGARALTAQHQQRAQRRRLLRRLGRRRAALLGSQGNVAKWQAELSTANDHIVTKLLDSIELCDNLIEILDGLSKNYNGYVKALSREISARISDREKWYGRPGQGR